MIKKHIYPPHFLKKYLFKFFFKGNNDLKYLQFKPTWTFAEPPSSPLWTNMNIFKTTPLPLPCSRSLWTPPYAILFTTYRSRDFFTSFYYFSGRIKHINQSKTRRFLDFRVAFFNKFSSAFIFINGGTFFVMNSAEKIQKKSLFTKKFCKNIFVHKRRNVFVMNGAEKKIYR